MASGPRKLCRSCAEGAHVFDVGDLDRQRFREHSLDVVIDSLATLLSSATLKILGDTSDE